MRDFRECGCTGDFGCFICDIRGQKLRTKLPKPAELKPSSPATEQNWPTVDEFGHVSKPIWEPSAPVESPTPAMKDEVESATLKGHMKDPEFAAAFEKERKVLEIEESRQPVESPESMSTGDAAETRLTACKLRTDGGTTCAATPCQCKPSQSPEMAKLVALLRKSKQLASIGYRIGEADMRGHDKIGERYGKQQDELIAEIDTLLDHIRREGQMNIEITEADKQAAFQRRLAYIGKTGHYESSEDLTEEIEALKRILRAGNAVDGGLAYITEVKK